MKSVWAHAGSFVALSFVLSVACSDDDEFSSKPTEDAGSDSSQAGSGGGAGAGATGGSAGSDAAAEAQAGAAGMDAAVEVCSDMDGDGVTDCDGDCDDADPLNFPGNPEVCGDNADNDCDGTADQSCAGLGTYVSATTGDDANPGTKDQPVKTIGQGIQNAVTILGNAGGSLDVFVAEGHYSEKVTLVENVNLRGGYACAAQPCSWSRDPKQNDSAILNLDFEGVIAGHTITKATRIDGFRIAGKTGDPTGSMPGTVALSLKGTPTVANNVIVAGDSQGGLYKDGNSYGIALIAPSNDVQGALIDKNTISGGASPETSAAIAMISIAIPTKVYAVITRNTLTAGSAKHSRGLVAWTSGTGTVIRNNDIQAGHGTDSSWGIEISSIALIDANRINADTNAPPGADNPSSWSGGIQSASSTTVITNNVIFGADAMQSAGVRLGELEKPAGAVVLNGNYIAGGGALTPTTGSKSAAIVLSNGGCCSTTASVGRIANNILLGGVGSARFGVWEQPGKVVHPEALIANDLYISTPTTADALYLLWNGQVTSAKTTIADVNALAAQLGSVSANISADPLVDSTWHLSAGSPCIDAGTMMDLPPQDLEGEARPKGAAPDIGPDEAQ
jgi:hypothetical protein